MNTTETHTPCSQPPTRPEALSFWLEGQVNLNSADQYRGNNWPRFQSLVTRGTALQAAAVALGEALERQIHQ